MCTRFVYHGYDIITGFNFDIDPAVCSWQSGREISEFPLLHDDRRLDGTVYQGTN